MEGNKEIINERGIVGPKKDVAGHASTNTLRKGGDPGEGSDL
jgi:hypothetical protein